MGDLATLQCEFDRVMSPAHQARWLIEVHWRDRDGLRVSDRELRAMFAPRFERLRAMPAWAEVEPVLRRYVRCAVPAPRRAERGFWAAGCLPPSEEAVVLARLVVGPEEVCTVTADDALTFSFRLGLDPLDLPRFATRAGLSVADLRARPDGELEVVISAVGAGCALALFDDEVILRGMRRFNLDLARRGRCEAGDQHCFELADALLAESDMPAAPATTDAAYREPEAPEVPPAPPLDEAAAAVDRMLADGRFEAAREALWASLLRDGADPADLDPDQLAASRAERVGAALRARVAEIADDDPVVLAWAARAALVRDCGGADALNTLLLMAGRYHRRAGRPARGVEFVARALGQLECRLAELGLHLLELGRCYTALNDLDRAQTHLTVALRQVDTLPSPSAPLALRAALAERHLRAGDHGAARANLRTALGVARARAETTVYAPLLAPLAWSEEHLGELSPAVQHYGEALAALRSDAPAGLRRAVLAGLVRCYDRLGEAARADAHLARAEAMAEPAWPLDGPAAFEALVDACLALGPAAPHDPPAA
jgi:tetratricopeptide (TPR) repeat protein